MRHTPFLTLILLAPLLVVAGCAQPKLPQENYYRLVTAEPADKGVVLDGSLVVEPFIGNGLTSERSLLYSTTDAPLKVQQYHYHYWIDPPPQMIQDQVVSYLRSGGVAANVVTPEMRLLPDYALTGRIKRLERIVDGSRFSAVVELEIGLSDARDNSLVLLETYVAEEPAGRDMASTVEAFNRGITKILEKFVADLGGAQGA
ncbi:MAG: membrane integrity-associated transporter subunit PqiC [Alphaproteobacteria bacterium]|nr:membrane integrity-associated transporter subunit PqiC [Alphaproteobacteria bacterium]